MTYTVFYILNILNYIGATGFLSLLKTEVESGVYTKFLFASELLNSSYKGFALIFVLDHLKK